MDVQSENEMSRLNEHLKMPSEIELLELYNRKENVRNIGLQEKLSTDEINRNTHEALEEAIQRVKEWYNFLIFVEPKSNDNDISITHKLQTRKPGKRPNIVQIERKTKKLQLLKNKTGKQEWLGECENTGELDCTKNFVSSTFRKPKHKSHRHGHLKAPSILSGKKTTKSTLCEDSTKVAPFYSTTSIPWYHFLTERVTILLP